jgi:HSP20 family molecular chaperone IbpA
MSPQEVQAQDKRKLEKEPAAAVPAPVVVPDTDIVETNSGQSVILEMPGADKANVDRVEDGTLPIDGRLNFAKYDGMQPVYGEYRIGRHRRSFSFSNKIGQSKVGTEMEDGVLTVALPKVEEDKPRTMALG